MNLPNANAAIVPPEKVRDYLLSPRHPVGRYKAAFFISHGYETSEWETLAADICGLLPAQASLVDTTEFGKKYTISGEVIGPNGRKFGLTTVWIILSGENAPRLVTAYPEN